MKSDITRKPYCPPSRRAFREEAQASVLLGLARGALCSPSNQDRRDEAKAKLLEFARGVLSAWDDQKSAMTKEEYRLRVRYAHIELRRVAEVLGFDADSWRIPELKDIPY